MDWVILFSTPDIDISPILEWAWAILQFAVTYVWIFCVLIFTWILGRAVIDMADKAARGEKSRVGNRRKR